MSFSDIMAIIGGTWVVFHVLKLAWRCWCGLREFVLSEVWQVDLRTYGQWAGNVEENTLNVWLIAKMFTISIMCIVCVHVGEKNPLQQVDSVDHMKACG